MTLDRPLLGIGLMLGFCLFAPLADAAGKHLSLLMPIAQLVAVRFVAQVVLLWPYVVRHQTLRALSRRSTWLLAARALLHIIGLMAMFTALRYLPLADAVAIAFVMPFIMLLLGWAVLGETVGIRRLLACAVGFSGTLLVVQPSFAAVGWPALLPLVVALVFALFMLVTRAMAKDVDAFTMQAVSGLMACGVAVPAVALGTWFGWPLLALVPVSGQSAMILIIFGILGVVAHLSMTYALRFAPTSTLAPVQYLEIPIAAVVGWLVFGDFPNGLALTGIAIIMGAGLYILWREHVTAQAQPQPTPAPPAAE